jgi:hypothetical protein
MSKKRDRNEISGGDSKNYNDDMNGVTEEMVMECEENEFKISNLIDGYNVHVESFLSNSDFEVALRKKEPDVVILYEPYLEFMRALEVYNAERIKFDLKKTPIEI